MNIKTYSYNKQTKIQIIIKDSMHEVLVDSFIILDDVVMFTLASKEQYSITVPYLSSILSPVTVTKIIETLIKGANECL